jgi:hypothetical protein
VGLTPRCDTRPTPRASTAAAHPSGGFAGPRLARPRPPGSTRGCPGIPRPRRLVGLAPRRFILRPSAFIRPRALPERPQTRRKSRGIGGIGLWDRAGREHGAAAARFARLARAAAGRAMRRIFRPV